MVRSDRSARSLTYEDYCKIPDDGLRHEIVEGVERVSPAPYTWHQTVLGRLHHALYPVIERGGHGRVFFAPVDVQLSAHDIVQPDLVVVWNESLARIGPAKIDGPPALVVEILSPSTQMHDLHRKRRLYERAGVAEYWIVDPDEAAIQRLVLLEGSYAERLVDGESFVYEGRPDVAVTVALTEVFQR